jgi:hypothetical protein
LLNFWQNILRGVFVMQKLKNLQVKGFVVGMMAMFLLMGTVAMASPVTREVIFGVGVSFNGAPVNFEYDMRPFVMDGRTFLPVRAVANLFGAEIDFNAATNTVILTSGDVPAPIIPAPVPTPEPLPTPAPVVETGPLTEVAPFVRRSHSRRVTTEHSAIINGVTFNSVLNISLPGEYAVFNLSGLYTTLNGYIGMTTSNFSEHNRRNTVFNFVGDGRLLASFDVAHSRPALPYSVDVRGVQELMIERAGGTSCSYAVSGILE